MVGTFFTMIVGHISTYVVKSYLTSLVFFPCLSMETSIPLFFFFSSILDFHSLKSRAFTLTSQMHEDINSFRAGWFLLQEKQWNFTTQGGLFVHLDSLFSFRFTGGNVCVDIPMTKIWYSLTSVSILLFSRGSKSMSSCLLQHLVMEIWKPSGDHVTYVNSSKYTLGKWSLFYSTLKISNVNSLLLGCWLSALPIQS